MVMCVDFCWKATKVAILFQAIVVALIAISLALLARPPAPSNPQWARTLIAHRCGAALGPENTIEALEITARYAPEATAVEFDIQLTKDGQAIVFHDFGLDRLTNASGHVKDLTLAELQALAVTVKPRPHYRPYPFLTEDTIPPQPSHIFRIPTFDAMIESALKHNFKMVIESKELHDRPRMAQLIMDAFKRYDLYDKAIVASFDPIIVYMVRSEPRIPTILFSRPFYIGDLCSKQERAYEHSLSIGKPGNRIIPLPICKTSALWDVVVEFLHTTVVPRFLGLFALGREHSAVTVDTVNEWASQGFAINAWVVDTPSLKKKLYEAGALVTSDCPDFVTDCAGADPFEVSL